MNELATIEKTPIIPKNWNYGESVEKVKQQVYKWKNLTIELATELYIAREKLSMKSSQSSEWGKYCDDIGVDRSTIHRWLERYFTPKSLPHVANATGENEWYTPEEHIIAAREVMGSIDCDPASSSIANATVKAKKFYTQEDNGLDQKWADNVWLNPPYAQPLISEFSEKLISKFQAGEVKQAIVLVNNATETNWFQNMLVKSTAVCFIKGRVKFIDTEGNPGGSPLQGQAILYFGKNDKKFYEAYNQFGIILWNGE